MVFRSASVSLLTFCLVALSSVFANANHFQSPHAYAMPFAASGGMMVGQPLAATAFVVESWSPPGTVGETYTRPSHPIPSDKHPRAAMLAVRDSAGAPIITVDRMGGFRMKNGVWLFESERPLDHGRCQIVRVDARKTVQDIEPYSSKFVRLIPGRIVYLDF